MSLTYPLTYPLAMPPVGPGAEQFELQRFDYPSVTNGAVAGVSAGWPLWKGRWTLGQSISRFQSDEWRALVDSLDGQQKTFLGREYAKALPRAHAQGFGGMVRAGGGAFDGAATSWSVNTDRDEVTLSGLPVGLTLSHADQIMWRWTTGGEARRSLVRVVTPAVADGSGVITVSVRPPLPTVTSSSAVADLVDPCCVMRLVTEETQVGEKDRRGRVSATIVGLQVLRA